VIYLRSERRVEIIIISYGESEKYIGSFTLVPATTHD